MFNTKFTGTTMLSQEMGILRIMHYRAFFAIVYGSDVVGYIGYGFMVFFASFLPCPFHRVFRLVSVLV
jgi:hypothetical protein